MNTPPLTPAQRDELESAYRLVCSLVPTLAALLGKPSPLKTHDERRREKLQPVDNQRSK